MFDPPETLTSTVVLPLSDPISEVNLTSWSLKLAMILSLSSRAWTPGLPS